MKNTPTILLKFERVAADVPLQKGDFWVGHNDDPNDYESSGESWKPISDKCYGITPGTNDPHVNIGNGAYWRPTGMASPMYVALPKTLEIKLSEEHPFRLHKKFRDNSRVTEIKNNIKAAVGFSWEHAEMLLLASAREHATSIIASNPGLDMTDFELYYSVAELTDGLFWDVTLGNIRKSLKSRFDEK